MNRETQQLIEGLKKEGKLIAYLMMNIAKELGTATGKKYGYNWYYEYKNKVEVILTIQYDDYGGNLSASYLGSTILNVHLGDVIAYRPDIAGWREIIDSINITANVKIQERETEKNKREDQRLFDCWGIKT